MKIHIYPKSMLETVWQRSNHPCVFDVGSHWTTGWSSTP